MVQDESRHTEAWLKLIEEAGGTAERDPYLDELAHMTLEADTLEEKVFQMQVFYERLIIARFRLIARASRGTVLEDLFNRLTPAEFLLRDSNTIRHKLRTGSSAS